MDAHALQMLLATLIERWESEVVEFKRAGDGFSTAEFGKYFSALANEANLRDQERAWLVFGVGDKNRTVVGTDYRVERDRLHSLKMQIAYGAVAVGQGGVGLSAFTASGTVDMEAGR